jgi:hypothetical protein
MNFELTNSLQIDRMPIHASGIIFNISFNGRGLSKINVNICK